MMFARLVGMYRNEGILSGVMFARSDAVAAGIPWSDTF